MSDTLAALLPPLVRPCTQLTVTPSPEALAPSASRFGGLPYCEAGESWPMCASCQRGLSFIAQIDLRRTVVREPHVDLFAFYYCWECLPQEHSDDAWEIRSYLDPRDDAALTLEPPPGVVRHPECRIDFREARSLPTWEELYVLSREVCEASAAANPDAPWEPYRAASAQLIGAQPLGSAVGGHARWLRGNEPPADARFVAQLGSESAAAVAWGAGGLIYLFLSNEEPPAWWMVLQSA